MWTTMIMIVPLVVLFLSTPLMAVQRSHVITHTTFEQSRTVQANTEEPAQDCFKNIVLAANSSGVVDNSLDQQDFIAFCNQLSNNSFTGITNFTSSFPLQLVILYNQLAVSSCWSSAELCQERSTIDVQPLVNATLYNQTLSPVEASFYTDMCVTVNRTIQETVVGTPNPTSGPSSLRPSMKPTAHRPTFYPTGIPSTNPSRSPTAAPTANRTVQPTFIPTTPPSNAPTTQPSSTPTIHPSLNPSIQPSPIPTRLPTTHPTSSPSSKPSTTPSGYPSSRPTSHPTSSPSSRPSSRPSILPTRRPSKHPTVFLTKKPTFAPALFSISTSFILVNTAGLSTEDIVSDSNYILMLDSSFRKLVQYALSSLNARSSRRRRLTEIRHLILTSTNSRIVSLQNIVCPSSLPAKVACQRVVGNATISSINENITKSLNDVSLLLKASIADGHLTVYLNSTIFSAIPDLTTPSTPKKNIGSGVIAGITVGAVMLGVLAAIALLVSRRQSPNSYAKAGMNFFVSLRSPTAQDHSLIGASTPNYGRMNISGSNSDVEGSDESGRLNDTLLPELNPGAVKSSPLKFRTSRSFDEESSSNAGSSGWSSSAGASSYTSASGNSLEYGMFQSRNAGTAKMSPLGRFSSPEKKQFSVSFSPLGVRSLNSLEDEWKEPSSKQKSSVVSHVDLHHAIEKGDWDTVGATAAILAQQESKSDTSSRKSLNSSMSATSETSLYRDRAIELDHLIEIGDWEGVVMAAAKFEAEMNVDNKSSSVISPGHSISTKESVNQNNSIGFSSDFSQSGSGSINSKARKLAEQRAEVVALVKRVVPSEGNNVDEMMFQFQGREDELLETLRSMQERSIAQRARIVSHRDARIKAKSPARFSWIKGNDHDSLGLPPPGPRTSLKSKTQQNQVPLHPSATSATQENLRFPSPIRDSHFDVDLEHADDTISSQSLGSLLSGESKTNARAALETAIEAGDWNAAGYAAARMGGDASESSVATSDLGSLGESSYSSRRSRNSRQPELVRARVMELDTLIENGDWKGVVAAATRFSAADATNLRDGNVDRGANQTVISKSDLSSLGTGSGSESANWKKRLFKRNIISAASSRDGSRTLSNTNGSSDRALQSEQEALAQAHIWEKIAAQSKSDGTAVSKGAIDAADWAISRSLTALKVQEQSSPVKGRTKNTFVGSSSQSIGSSTLEQSL